MKFDLGQLVTTPGASDLLAEGASNASQLASDLLKRHSNGDWGEVPPEDAALNNEAIANEGDFAKMSRAMSSYTVNNKKLWIITERDRSSTTLLLPSEY